MQTERESLIERLRKLVETGKSYAKSELNGAPTSTFEIYMGHFAAITDEIAAALSSMEAGAAKVKALEWEEVTCDHFTAQSMLGEYTAIRDEHGCMWWQNPSNAIDADNLDAAKSAAQADYERRVRSALDHSPASPVTDEMVQGDDGFYEFDRQQATIATLRAERDEARRRVASLETSIEKTAELEREGYKALHYSEELQRAEAAEMKLIAAEASLAWARDALEKIEDVDFDGYSISELHELVTDIARTALARLDTPEKK